MRFESGAEMQLDLFIPKHKLAFEYQGVQHFVDVHRFLPQRVYAYRDEQKRKVKSDFSHLERLANRMESP